MASKNRILVVEDDSFLRVIAIVLDPNAPVELMEAFAHFCAHDLPDFSDWCEQMRAGVRNLYPCDVRLVRIQADLLATIRGAEALVVEALAVGAGEIAAAGGTLKVVHRYGTITRHIDNAACANAGVQVKTVRRRANISTAEQGLMLMLALARQLNRNLNLISTAQLRSAGYNPTQYDRTRTPNGNWARIPGMITLYRRQLGIVGLGEIGREFAIRAAALGMRIVYYQRHRLTSAEEQQYGVHYCSLSELLQTSDCISLHLPRGPETRGIIGAREFEIIKPGALLINVSQPQLIDRHAVYDALTSGRLGGLAMDSFYEEPGNSDDPLLSLPSVIVTPHLAGSPRFNSLDDIQELLENISGILR